MKRRPTRVGDLVSSLISEIDKKQLCTQDEIETVWLKTVGFAGHQHAKPSSLQKGILRIAVDNSCWIQELTIKKRGILKKLQSHFGKDKINDIRFKIKSS